MECFMLTRRAQIRILATRNIKGTIVYITSEDTYVYAVHATGDDAGKSIWKQKTPKVRQEDAR